MTVWPNIYDLFFYGHFESTTIKMKQLFFIGLAHNHEELLSFIYRYRLPSRVRICADTFILLKWVTSLLDSSNDFRAVQSLTLFEIQKSFLCKCSGQRFYEGEPLFVWSFTLEIWSLLVLTLSFDICWSFTFVVQGSTKGVIVVVRSHLRKMTVVVEDWFCWEEMTHILKEKFIYITSCMQ